MKNTDKLNRHIFIRDNLDVLRALDDKSVDLIYLDPPFNKNKIFGAPIGSEVAGQHFKDIWTYSDTDDAWWGELSDKQPALYEMIHAVGCVNGESHKSYLIAMAMRLLELKRILSDTGSIYLHCDPTMSHSLKLVMDAIFKKRNFINDIIWQRASGRAKIQHQKGQKSLGNDTDNILHYSKSKKFKKNFKGVYKQLSEEEMIKKFPLIDNNGRRYNTKTPIFGSPTMGSRPKQCYTYKGITPPHSSGWRFSKKRLIAEDKKGNIIWREGKKPLRKSYADEYKGKPIGSLWCDIDYASKGERTKYSTQKPLPLLERIIQCSCPEKGIVLDPFCGCATTCVASEKLKRKWIGIDLSPLAEKLVKQRLLKQFKQGVLGKKMVNPIVRDTLPIKNAKKPPKDIRHTLYGRQKGICKLCKTHFEFRMFQLDHIVPKSKGGQDTPENLQLLCGPCNYQKGTKSMTEVIAKFAKQSSQLSDNTKKISYKETEGLNQKQLITIIKKLLNIQKTNQPYKNQ